MPPANYQSHLYAFSTTRFIRKKKYLKFLHLKILLLTLLKLRIAEREFKLVLFYSKSFKYSKIVFEDIKNFGGKSQQTTFKDLH